MTLRRRNSIQGRRRDLASVTAQALVIAEGKKINEVLKYLDEVKQAALSLQYPGIHIYSPIPQSIMRIQDIERGQLLLEADSKKVMQEFLLCLLLYCLKK